MIRCENCGSADGWHEEQSDMEKGKQLNRQRPDDGKVREEQDRT